MKQLFAVLGLFALLCALVFFLCWLFIRFLARLERGRIQRESDALLESRLRQASQVSAPNLRHFRRRN